MIEPKRKPHKPWVPKQFVMPFGTTHKPRDEEEFFIVNVAHQTIMRALVNSHCAIRAKAKKG
jgi:hypothetical protein